MQKRTIAIILGLAFPFSVALARPYPDVPGDTLYLESIYGLQRMGIMTGNDDGTFGYSGTLNRAALLTLAYRAAERTVHPIYYDGSFRDVKEGQWFTDVIYTAKHNGDIQGYPDGTARPGDDVNLVEALKIVLNSLRIPLPVLTQADRLSVGGFIGTTTGAWYLPWLNTAFILDLLPQEILEDNELDPSGPVTREIAAEIIYRALNANLSVMADRKIIETPEDDIKDKPEETEEPVNFPSPYTTTNPDPELTGKTEPTKPEETSLPLHRTGKTGDRGAVSYIIDIDIPQNVLVEAHNLTSQTAGIQCYLYPLDDSGFTSVFFIGFKEQDGCMIRAALSKGRHQIEIRSPSEGADYSLDVDAAEGDGNDGSMESVSLRVGAPRFSTLISDDYEDWYKFIVPAKESHRVKLNSSHDLSCMLFPSANVDLSGFAIPECGKSAEFDPGTWYISVKKKKGARESQSYTVELR